MLVFCFCCCRFCSTMACCDRRLVSIVLSWSVLLSSVFYYAQVPAILEILSRQQRTYEDISFLNEHLKHMDFFEGMPTQMRLRLHCFVRIISTIDFMFFNSTNSRIAFDFRRFVMSKLGLVSKEANCVIYKEGLVSFASQFHSSLSGVKGMLARICTRSLKESLVFTSRTSEKQHVLNSQLDEFVFVFSQAGCCACACCHAFDYRPTTAGLAMSSLTVLSSINGHGSSSYFLSRCP